MVGVGEVCVVCVRCVHVGYAMLGPVATDFVRQGSSLEILSKFCSAVTKSSTLLSTYAAKHSCSIQQTRQAQPQ